MLGLPCYAGFSLVVVSGGCSVVAVYRLLSAVALRHMHSALWRPGSRAQAQYLWPLGFVAPRYVGSSWISDLTHVSCAGRWILLPLNHQGSPTIFFFRYIF